MNLGVKPDITYVRVGQLEPRYSIESVVKLTPRKLERAVAILLASECTNERAPFYIRRMLESGKPIARELPPLRALLLSMRLSKAGIVHRCVLESAARTRASQ